MKINFAKELFICNDSTDKSEVIIHEKCRVTKNAITGKSIYEIFKDYDIHDIIISRLKKEPKS